MSLSTKVASFSEYKGNDPENVKFYIKENCLFCNKKAEFVVSCGVHHFRCCNEHLSIATESVVECESIRLGIIKPDNSYIKDF